MAGVSATLRKVFGSVAIGLTICIGTVGLSSGALADSGAVDVSPSKVAAAQEMLPGAAGQPPIQGVRVSMGGYSIVLPEEAQAVQTDEEGSCCSGDVARSGRATADSGRSRLYGRLQHRVARGGTGCSNG